MTLQSWMAKHQFQYQQTNVQPWGSFTLLVSIDGGPFAEMPRRFGNQWKLEVACEECLRELYFQKNTHGILEQWMGKEMFQEFLHDVGQPATNILPARY